MAILSNLLVLHRRFDFSQSYLTAASAPGLPSREDGGKKKRKKEGGERRSNLQFIHIGGKMFNAVAVIHLSSLIKEKTLPILFPPFPAIFLMSFLQE